MTSAAEPGGPTELVDEADAYRYLERLRWPGGVPDRCPHCATDRGAWFLTPADGRSRPTSTGARSSRRLWKCRGCRRQYSVLTGTVLQGIRTELLTCLEVIIDRSATRPGAATADRLGLTASTVRQLGRRLDLAEATAGVTGSPAP